MITVKQLIQNTTKNEAVGGYRHLILEKYNQYRKKTKKKLVVLSNKLPYNHPEKRPYFVTYWKILSENRKNVWYDVIIQFITENRIAPDTQVRIFCNSPQFTYTYAYCFNQTGDLIFEYLYEPIVLSEKPKERNPLCLKGLDKHVYVGIKESISNRLTYDKVNKLKLTQWPEIMTVKSFEMKFLRKR